MWLEPQLLVPCFAKLMYPWQDDIMSSVVVTNQLIAQQGLLPTGSKKLQNFLCAVFSIACSDRRLPFMPYVP